MLDNVHELPVLNAEGEVEGYLSRSTLADILSDHPSSETNRVESNLKENP
jgi:glycine betaine/proline transport system ATP-binding protein